MGPNPSVNSRHSDENHLSLSLWGSPGFYKYPPDYQLDHTVLPSTALSCHRLGPPFTRRFVQGSPPCENMFLHVVLGPRNTEASFTIFCYKCSVIIKDEFKLVNLKVLVKPSGGDTRYPCCDHSRNSSAWLFSAQHQRDTLGHKHKPSGTCKALLQLNNQNKKCALCTQSLSCV